MAAECRRLRGATDTGPACSCPRDTCALAVRLAETRHVLELRVDGWALEHPLACRTATSLLDCQYHQAAGDLTGDEAPLGRWYCALHDGRIIVPLEPAPPGDAAMAMPLLLTSDSEGALRIAQERQRQIDTEGFTAAHDDAYTDGELPMAAACYAAYTPLYMPISQATSFAEGAPDRIVLADPWPWAREWDKRSGGPGNANRMPHAAYAINMRHAGVRADRIRDLEKAGALIAAEIDRLLRQEG